MRLSLGSSEFLRLSSLSDLLGPWLLLYMSLHFLLRFFSSFLHYFLFIETVREIHLVSLAHIPFSSSAGPVAGRVNEDLMKVVTCRGCVEMSWKW